MHSYCVQIKVKNMLKKKMSMHASTIFLKGDLIGMLILAPLADEDFHKCAAYYEVMGNFFF